MTAPYVAMKKLTGSGIIRTAAKHNLRELQAEVGANSHIDAMRMGSNIILTGPPSAAEIVALSEQLMVEAGAQIKRKDAVRGIEIVFSLPPETKIDPDAILERWQPTPSASHSPTPRSGQWLLSCWSGSLLPQWPSRD